MELFCSKCNTLALYTLPRFHFHPSEVRKPALSVLCTQPSWSVPCSVKVFSHSLWDWWLLLSLLPPLEHHRACAGSQRSTLFLLFMTQAAHLLQRWSPMLCFWWTKWQIMADKNRTQACIQLLSIPGYRSNMIEPHSCINGEGRSST